MEHQLGALFCLLTRWGGRVDYSQVGHTTTSYHSVCTCSTVQEEGETEGKRVDAPLTPPCMGQSMGTARESKKKCEAC
jgi:hypothetical protein